MTARRGRRNRSAGLALLLALLASCGTDEEPSPNEIQDFGVNDEAPHLAGANPAADALLVNGDNNQSANVGASANAADEAGNVNTGTGNEADEAAGNDLAKKFDLGQAEKGLAALNQSVSDQGNRIGVLERRMSAEAARRDSQPPWLAYAALALLALTGLAYWMWRASKRSREDAAARAQWRSKETIRIDGRLDQLESQLSEIAEQLRAPPEPGPKNATPAPYDPPADRKPEPQAPKVPVVSEPETFEQRVPPSLPVAAAPIHPRSPAIAQAFSYMAAKTPAREDYEMALRSFGTLYDARVDSNKEVTLTSFTGGNATILMTAIDLAKGSYALVPSFYVVKEFALSYHEAVEAESLLEDVFEMEKDNSKTLRCLSPAIARSDGSGVLTVSEPGRLSGFTRAR